MISPELFKIRHHRTPWVLLGTFCLLLLPVPVWLAFRPPADPTEYLSGMTGIFSIVGMFLAAVYGAWIVGHEYRQGTLRRVLAVDARRSRLLAVKTVVAAGVLAVGVAVAAAFGIAASMASAAFNGDTLVFDGVVRELLAGAFGFGVTALIALLLSVVFRSDTYAMLGALAVMIVLGPVVQLIPKVGKFTPFAATSRVASAISDVPDATLSLLSAGVALTGTVAAVGFVATFLFNYRDI